MAQNGIKTPLAGSGIYDWVTGQITHEWFGPGVPIAPSAPQTAGRQFDYPTAVNLHYYPKRNEGVSFAELRALADGYDLLRLVIETRKDEMEFCEWKIQTRDGKETKATRLLQDDLYTPDREHTWHQWQRMLLEELFVTDAPAIYARRTINGDPYSLEIVDGATIKRLLDETGRTPLEGPAYQQILHGVVTANFDRTELFYVPRNLRVNRIYGYSPVEQVITTVNIALRRQAHQLSYYTEGSVPDLIFRTPDGWTTEQIAHFQSWWNSLYSEGNVENRRMARFVPNGVEPYNTKEAALKDQYDEWLARIICFAFSVSPQALIAQMNRATAEVAEETSKSSGLEPIKNWLKGLMDKIIHELYQQPEFEFVWIQKDAIRPVEQAQIHSTYVQCNVLDTNEVREEIGYQPRKYTPATPNMDGQAGSELASEQPQNPANTANTSGAVQDTALNGAQVSSLVQIIESVTSGILPKESAIQLILAAFPNLAEERVKGIINPLEEKETKIVEPNFQQPPPPFQEPQPSQEPKPEKLKKAARIPAIDRDREAIKKLKTRLQSLFKSVFVKQREAAIQRLKTSIGKSDGAYDWVSTLWDLGIDFDRIDDLEEILRLTFKNGGQEALNLLSKTLKEHGIDMPHTGVSVDLVNEKAAEWAREHAVALVAKISETTRESLKSLTSSGIERGLSVDELASEIMNHHTFSRERAELIAVTELAEADVRGNKQAYAESGVVSGLQWITANSGNDERTCEDCELNDGAIVPIGPDGMATINYPSGAKGVPAHPRCICDEIPVLKEDE